MANSSKIIADFYHQLALLTSSNLPLPDSIRQMGDQCSNPQFKEVLLKVCDELEKGASLEATLAKYPDYFSEFDRNLITAGEETGNLSHTLFQLSRNCYFSNKLNSKIKESLTYPFVCINILMMVMFLLNILIIPEFAKMFNEMLDGEPLPTLTGLITNISLFVKSYWPLVMIVYIFGMFFFAWLYNGNLKAQKYLKVFVSIFPMYDKIVDSLDSARICSLWSILMKQNTPVPQLAAVTADVMESPRMNRSLKEIAKKTAAGEDLKSCMVTNKGLNKLLKLTVIHSPEDQLPEDLHQLGDVFEQKAKADSTHFCLIWEAIFFLILAFSVGGCIIGLFLPLIKLVEKLGG